MKIKVDTKLQSEELNAYSVPHVIYHPLFQGPEILSVKSQRRDSEKDQIRFKILLSPCVTVPSEYTT